jgi:hypothetical protein
MAPLSLAAAGPKKHRLAGPHVLLVPGWLSTSRRSRSPGAAGPRVVWAPEVGCMAQVEDRWWSRVNGRRVVRERCGRGLRWRARYRDAEGRQRSRSFARKPDALRFLALVQADLLRGSYIDPGRSRTALSLYADLWINFAAAWASEGGARRLAARRSARPAPRGAAGAAAHSLRGGYGHRLAIAESHRRLG